MRTKAIPTLTDNDVTRFWRYVEKSANCWEWQGSLNRQRRNYGIFGLQGKNYGTHRVSYFIANGIDPLTHYVCHRCDNPRCVRPSHLFLGTALTNMQDRDAKGRHIPPIGERNGQAKVNEDMVRDIRKRYSAGETQAAIALGLGLNHSTIGYIVRRKTWGHV